MWNIRGEIIPNQPETRQQTQNSGEKNRGVGVEHRGVCVECSKQTQNAETKNRRVSVKHRGVCVCGMFEVRSIQTNPKLGNKKSWVER